jgi:type II restriction enzyme
MNVLVKPSKAEGKGVKIPIDAVIQPKKAKLPRLPIFIEAKSAGDYTNVNKRRKEEATKINQLKATFGEQVVFVLFLCGYFDAAYLGYEAAEGIDWIWEHRTKDLDQLGI